MSLCAGGGGLDMGLMLAEPGFHTRCWVEWEEYPRQVLVAGQRAGYFAPAPIWDDLRTFDGRPWRGHVDTVLAGYPCQPFSHAGQRRGADDERHLWPDVARVIGECAPRWVFLENVEGHISLGLDAVLGDLERLGYSAACGLFSTAETGGSQTRKRVFIVACNKGIGRDARRLSRRTAAEIPESRKHVGPMGHHDQHDASAERQQRGGELGRGQEAGSASGNAMARRGEAGRRGRPEQNQRPEAGQQASRRGDVERCGGALGHASGNGSQAGRPDQARGQEGLARIAFDAGRPALSPPLPDDTAAWRAVLDVAPDLAPALSVRDIKRISDRLAALVAQGRMAEAEAESVVRGMADGLANRTRQLRLLGNGVVPITAGHAWRTLALAHGLRPLDLEAGNAGGA